LTTSSAYNAPGSIKGAVDDDSGRDPKIDTRLLTSNYVEYVDASGSFAQAIEAALPSSTTLTAADIIQRASFASCNICHDGVADLGGGVAGDDFRAVPTSYAHVEGTLSEQGAYGPAHRVSPFLRHVAIPYRLGKLAAALAAARAP